MLVPNKIYKYIPANIRLKYVKYQFIVFRNINRFTFKNHFILYQITKNSLPTKGAFIVPS